MKINWLICHHTGGTDLDPLADTSNQSFEDVNAWHRQNPNVWLGKLSFFGYAIGYHYFIDKKGKITQGRKDTEQAAHTKGYNNNPWDPPENSAIGICLAGNFDLTTPTQLQVEALKWLLDDKTKEHGISIANIVPHRTYANKTCYGRLLADDWARKLIAPVVAPEPCITEKNDIIEKEKQISRLQELVHSIINFFRK